MSEVLDPILEEARAMRSRGEQLGLDMAFSLVDIAAEQEGRDYVYQKHYGSCANFKLSDKEAGYTGDCLIGRVFEFFVDYNDIEGRCSQHATAWQANRHYRNIFAPVAERFLDLVQERQDKGVPWGQAIDLTKAKFLDKL